MANMIVEDGKFVLSQEIAGAGTITKTLNTQNKFVERIIFLLIQNSPLPKISKCFINRHYC